MEHRWGYRAPIDVAVRLVVSPGTIGSGRIRDVSVTGAFVETNLDLTPLSIVHLEPSCFAAPAGSPERITAYVVRRSSAGAGLEWCDIPDQVLAALLHATAPPRKLNASFGEEERWRASGER